MASHVLSENASADFTAGSPVMMQSGKQVYVSIRSNILGDYNRIKIWGGSDEKPLQFTPLGGSGSIKESTIYLNSNEYIIYYQLSNNDGTKVSSVKALTLEEGVKDAYGNWAFARNTSL